MNFEEKKKNLVAEFNRNQQTIQQLNNRNQQILGSLQIIENIEKEEKGKKQNETKRK